jgi:hypothetical protein
MELIPILSTIILVATICTFILAIGAYILYKIRERKGEQSHYPPPSSVHAELVTPGESGIRQKAPARSEEIPAEPQYFKSAPAGGYQRSGEIRKEAPESYQAAEREAAAYSRVKTEPTTGKKFLKYTSDGYVPTEEDKKSGVLKWR